MSQSSSIIIKEASLRFEKNDRDEDGNENDNLYIVYGDKHIKISNDDLPRVVGMKNEVEILSFSDNIERIKKMQLTESFVQPYVSLDDKMISIWNTNTPQAIDFSRPDIEIPISSMSARRWLKINLTELDNKSKYDVQ